VSVLLDERGSVLEYKQDGDAYERRREDRPEAALVEAGGETAAEQRADDGGSGESGCGAPVDVADSSLVADRER
jgi:hypothetical protein